jgi:hypothetical protein
MGNVLAAAQNLTQNLQRITAFGGTILLISKFWYDNKNT